MSEGHTERLEAALQGKYRIERKLGEGGMASVYLAEDLKHERKVALKILRPELAAVLGAERFLAEIKTTANLQHPHILPLFDSGEAQGYLYYVMPYIEGETLREKLDREKQLGVEESVRIARDVADALDYAHRHGVIHRDIKPGNILLHDGRPVVADFGIALAVSAAGGGRMTETGLSLGTPHYMSPEQASADRDLSARSDVYSLGCVLYEMLAGQPPHTGPSAQSILVHILTEVPKPLTTLRHTVPPNVAAAVARAIEKLPADRFESARDFRDALEDAAFSYQATTRASTAPQVPGPVAAVDRRWSPLTVGFASLAAVLALALGWSSMAQPDAPPVRTIRQVLSTEGWLGEEAELGRYLALAPDGSSMILPVEGRLGLKLAGSTELVPLSDTERARDVVYSPDGQSIAYAVGTEVFTRQLFGGAPVRIAEGVEDAPFRVAMAWLDDGTFLYERPGPELVHVPDRGGDPLGTGSAPAALIWAAGLPGGRAALVITTQQELFAVDFDSSTTHRLLEGVVRAWHAPTGHVVYVRSDGAVLAVPFDLEELVVTGGAVPLFEGVRATVSRADMQLAADGTLVYAEGSSTGGGTGREIVVVDLEGVLRALPLGARPMGQLGLSWSPDGESIVFESSGDIYTYDVVRNTVPRQLTADGDNGRPLFSPDGRRVVFSSRRDDTDGSDLFVVGLDDPAPARLLLSLPGDQAATQWVTETLIVIESTSNDDLGDLWILDLSDPEAPEARPYLESEANLRRITVSPDGRLAAYRSTETAALEPGQIHLRSFPEPGADFVVPGPEGYVPIWSPDGGTLYFAVGPGDPMVAARLQAGPVPVVLSLDTLFNLPSSAAEPPAQALHPDGDRFLFHARVGDVVIGGGDSERVILVQNFFEELRERTSN